MNKQNTDTGSKAADAAIREAAGIKPGSKGSGKEMNDESKFIKVGRKFGYSPVSGSKGDKSAKVVRKPSKREQYRAQDSLCKLRVPATMAEVCKAVYGPAAQQPAPGERDETWTDMEQAPETSAAEHLIRTPSDLRYARLQAELERVKGQLAERDAAIEVMALEFERADKLEQQRDELLAALKETLAAFGRCRQTGDWKALNDWNLWNGVGAAIGRAEHASVEKEGK